jgi:hypothetical protein
VFPTQVALVPYREGVVPSDELLHVAAALQTQVTRDLGPHWELDAVVSPFLRLEDVPPGYVPFAIVDGLPKPWHGFHVVSSGQPLAVIGYRRDWSLLASHELMEVLCDPWGNRSLPGASIDKGQGQVEYLVEVCDPCQHDTYAINGVTISDFVTPAYYAPHELTGGRFSFTGSIKRPLEVRKGGYLTWRTPNGEVWQKAGEAAPRRLEAVPFTRTAVDAHRPTGRPDVGDKLRRGQAGQALDDKSRGYGKRLKAEVDVILAQIGVAARPADPDAIKRLLSGLATKGSDTRKAFKSDPEGVLREFGLDPPADPSQLKRRLLSPEHYQGVLAALDGGSGLGDPQLAAWLSTHAVFFHHAGIE